MDFGDFEISLFEKAGKFNKIAVIGIGADLREDDAIGNIIAREIIDKMQENAKLNEFPVIAYSESELIQTESVLIINASVIPEQYVTTVLSFNPDHVVIVDAAMMGNAALAGNIAFIQPVELDKITFSTHVLPLGQFIEILKTMGLDAFYTIIGVQPRKMNYGDLLSPEVEHTKVFLVSLLMSLMQRAFKNK